MKHARRIFQAGSLAFTLWAVFVLGSNAERWCPFGGVEAVYTYATEGNLVCSLGISNFYILGAVILTVLLLRRAFCGYACPIGTISEWLGALASRSGLRARRASPKLDRILSLGKYLVLAAILAATWQLGELVFRGYCPAYALLSRHGPDITFRAYVVAGGILVASLLVTIPFCRWLCPLAAVFNPFSRFGLGRIKRDEAACLRCGRCAESCPMAIPVDQLPQVTVSRCLSCLNCIYVCPKDKQQALFWGPPNRLGRAWPPATVAVVLLLCGGAAVAAAYLAPMPSYVKSRGIRPDQIAVVELRIQGLTCRGRASLLVSFLERDDMYRIPGPSADAPGYYRLEAWPDPNKAVLRVSFDPKAADKEVITRAIVEPYYDMSQNRWWMSPFLIDDYSIPTLGQ